MYVYSNYIRDWAVERLLCTFEQLKTGIMTTLYSIDGSNDWMDWAIVNHFDWFEYVDFIYFTFFYTHPIFNERFSLIDWLMSC